MNEYGKSIVLRYNSGQFSFRNFDPLATDEELHTLAHQLNSLQEDPVLQIAKVEVFQLR